MTQPTIFDQTTPPPRYGADEYGRRWDRDAAVAFVAWRAQFRMPVFAEQAARRYEAWITNYDTRYSEEIQRWAVRGGPMPARQNLDGDLFTLDRLLDGAAAQRPPRRMPSLRKIAEYHGLGPTPVCVRCGWYPPVDTWREASGWLERAHIIDRCFDGLDNVANIAPLCSPCHRSQPIFQPGDEVEALHWFAVAELRPIHQAPTPVRIPSTLDGEAA